MTFDLPGFPVEVSAPIELPDIAELLISPAFGQIAADDYRKYATEFQRSLLDQVPLRHDRTYVVIRSGVWLLEPGTRSHVANLGGWHCDDDPRVFILSSACSALTEFSATPLSVEAAPSECLRDVVQRIRISPERYGIVGRPIEPARIYTFDRHIHRAVDPKRIEFRFFLRVKETDEPPEETRPLTKLTVKTVNGPVRPNIEFRGGMIYVYIPDSMAAHV